MIFAKLRYVYLLLFLPGLVGCPADPICIQAVDTRATSLNLDFTQGQNCIPSTSIRSIEVLRETDNKTLWYVEYLGKSNSEFLEGQSISKFTYGVIPKGFSTNRALPIELHPGESIKVRVNGTPNRGTLHIKVR